MSSLLVEALAGLRRRGAMSFVAIGGLAIALCACLLVALIAIALAEPAPDVPDAERVVIVDFKGNPPGFTSPWFTSSPVAFGPMLKQRQLPLDQISRAAIVEPISRLNGERRPIQLLVADPDLAPLLGMRAIEGDLAATLRRHDAVAVTRDLARRLWGEHPIREVLGKTIELDGRPATVTAVLPDRDPRDPLWDRDAMAGFESAANTMDVEARDAIFLMTGRVFARLRPGVTVDQVGPWVRAAFQADPRYQQLPAEWRTGREPAYFRGLPLTRLPLEGEARVARWQRIGAAGAACALLLAMAVFNLINLQVGALLQRQRETALRRSLGASDGQLLALWGLELAIVVIVAGALAMGVAWWLAPMAGSGVGLPPSHPLADPVPGRAWAGLAIMLGLVWLVVWLPPAGPALRRMPAPALQGRTASEGPWGRRLRQALLALQLGGAALLLALCGVLAAQQWHLLHADRGFDVRGRLWLGLKVDPDRADGLRDFTTALSAQPAVRHWAFSSARPGVDNGGQMVIYRHGEHKETMRVTTVSAGFVDTFGMRLLAGRVEPAPMDGEPRVVIDAKAARALGFATPVAAVGALLRGGGGFLQEGEAPRRVVAVVGDVKLEGATTEARPQVFLLDESPQRDLMVHGDDLAALQRAIEDVWRRHGPRIGHEIRAVDELLASAYAQEQRLTGLIGAIALLAVGIAMLGGYALIADSLRRRRAELVLRRLHGASDAAIAVGLARDFLWPVGAALLIGLPLGAFAGSVYLRGFVDRVDLATGLVMPAVAAAVLTLVVTGLASARHLRLALRVTAAEALA
ncbi:MAG: ABC transporter permease [Mitsuaria chitosanitabida]|uniref:FtsX-like permease family protein n=1 Tax=Roseateles chitosanitabidus TaxID=65048 RepID=UPI001B22676A|nr:FtsX-like permease family protein [Roseateles chitosanitabidus]MBO9687109.1 ABC transporter permease [Roseateles chitosanitabidus]